jgi:hypothetical protein
MNTTTHRIGYKEKLQTFIQSFKHRDGDRPVTMREVAVWAIRSGLWVPGLKSAVDLLVRDLSSAARTAYFTDKNGRRVRRFHARRVEVELPTGETKQETFWDDITTAEPLHMHKAFQQRRRIIVSDCHQLKTDVDSYNDNWNPGNPIQMSWDFYDDVMELDFPTEYPDSESDLSEGDQHDFR